MHLADPIFIFILAFILLGPKKTSDLTRQVGKLMAEFRKASNDFKYQFNEEMRVADQQEQQKKQEAERTALPAGATGPGTALLVDATGSPTEPGAEPGAGAVNAPDVIGENTILPPAVAGSSPPAEPVPYAISAISATTGEEHPVEDHPLLRVDVIPPMDGTPADAGAVSGALQHAVESHGEASNGMNGTSPLQSEEQKAEALRHG